MAAVQETVDRVRRIDVDQYRYGFETLIESDKAPKGLSEDIVRFISAGGTRHRQRLDSAATVSRPGTASARTGHPCQLWICRNWKKSRA